MLTFDFSPSVYFQIVAMTMYLFHTERMQLQFGYLVLVRFSETWMMLGHFGQIMGVMQVLRSENGTQMKANVIKG